MKMHEERELDDDGIDLLQLWNTVSRRKWAILSLAFIVTLLTTLVVYAMTPIYGATALIHIQPQQANIVSIEEIYGVDTRRQDYYNTEAEILKSRPIAAKVIDAVGAPPEAAPSGIRRLSFDWRSLLPFKAPEPPGGSIDVDPREADIENYLEGLWITPVRSTQLVEVRYASEDVHRTIGGFGVELGGLHPCSTLLFREPFSGIDMDLGDGIGVRLCHGLDLDATLGAEHSKMLLG